MMIFEEEKYNTQKFEFHEKFSRWSIISHMFKKKKNEKVVIDKST